MTATKLKEKLRIYEIYPQMQVDLNCFNPGLAPVPSKSLSLPGDVR